MTENIDPDSVLDRLLAEPIEEYKPITRNDFQKREFRRLIKKELSSGALDPSYTSSFGKEINIVNLPNEFREFEVPYFTEKIYISNIKEEVETLLNEESPEVVAECLERINQHTSKIDRFLKRKEDNFSQKYDNIENSLEDLETMVGNFDNQLGESLEKIYINSRRESVKGVIDIRRDLTNTVDVFHRCEFEKADNILAKKLEQVDSLIVNIEFIKAINGTLAHGGGKIHIPEEIKREPLTEIINTFQNNNTNTEFNMNERYLRIQIAEPEQKKVKPDPNHDPSVHPSDVADELIYLFKELDGQTDTGYIEKQTKDLPDYICSADVLTEFKSFCSRQTDLVVDVSVQEEAPPGFLTIDFVEDVDSQMGMSKLQERVLNEYS